MANREARRVMHKFSAEQLERLRSLREQVAAEAPDLIRLDKMRAEARRETTLSGELRRAVHASDLSLDEVARRIGVDPLVLDEFLTGERTLRSDVMDRLAQALGYVFAPHA